MNENEQRYEQAREAVEGALAASRDVKAPESEDDCAVVVETLGAIKRASKLADEVRLELTKPLRDEVAATNDRFKELTGPLAGAEQGLKAQVAAFRRAEQQRINEERAREERNRRERQAREDEKARQRQAEEDAAAEAEKRPPEQVVPTQHEMPEIPDAPTTRSAGGAAATVRKVWRFEVVDADEVPRAYLAVNEQAIRQAVNNGEREIPGVRIYADDSVSVRS